MERNRKYSLRNRNFGSSNKKGKFFKGIVTAVITDNEHPLVEDGTLPLGRIGYIQFIPMNESYTSSGKGFFAAPLDKNFNTLPLRNERVDVLQTTSGYFYRRGNGNLSPNVDGVSNSVASIFQTNKNDTGGNSSDYKSASNTGIANKTDTSSDASEGFGEYFEGDNADSIHPLKLYEGDTLIQSRFGQSLRFSGYNNVKEELHPTIILRNRENSTSQNDLGLAEFTEEDLNRDGSTIAITSGEYKIDFQPGTVDDGCSTNFKTDAKNFDAYPSELKGDQILINSGRIILSAKDAEMIFYSKGNYGFISDGTLSIDNGGGIVAEVQDNISFTTNNNDYTIETGTGEIHLGNGGGEEPLVKGDQLVDVLKQLIDAINQMTHPTPAGPSGPPVNAPVFSQIKAKLDVILSTKNFVD